LTRASRRAQREGGEAARAVRGDPYGTEYLRNSARFSIGLEPLATASDLGALRLGPERTWLRLANSKSNYGETDVEIILERVRGAVQIVDMSTLDIGRTQDPVEDPSAPVRKTPGQLGFIVGETVTKSGIARRLSGLDCRPNDRQQEQGDRLAHQWAARGWVKPGDGGRGWKILALGTPAGEVPNAER